MAPALRHARHEPPRLERHAVTAPVPRDARHRPPRAAVDTVARPSPTATRRLLRSAGGLDRLATHAPSAPRPWRQLRFPAHALLRGESSCRKTATGRRPRGDTPPGSPVTGAVTPAAGAEFRAAAADPARGLVRRGLTGAGRTGRLEMFTDRLQPAPRRRLAPCQLSV